MPPLAGLLDATAAITITDTAFNWNKQYRQSGDAYDRLDYKRIATVVEGVYSFIMQHQ